MEKNLYVKIENGKKYGIENKEFTWSAFDKEEIEQIYIGATNFADGLIKGLELKGFRFERPYVPQLNGYWWIHGEMKIKIVNEKNKIIRKPEDI